MSIMANSLKKVFISHASKDHEVISSFVDSILNLGMNLDPSAIAYTSREDTGVLPGESIPQFIQDNIACADIVLLMISDNFRDSEVCLNEMGAAWALKKTIIQILLPNTSINKLGWLCSFERSIRINDSSALDSLYEIFQEKIGVHSKLSVWNRNKEEFIRSCASYNPMQMVLAPVEEVHSVDKDDLGILDYREMLDNNVAQVNLVCGKISDGLININSKLTTYNSVLQNLNTNNPSTSQYKKVMMAIAKVMNDMADLEDTNAPLLKTCFFDMVDTAVKLSNVVGHNTDIETGYDQVKELLIAISGAKKSHVELKSVIDNLPRIEATTNKAKKRLSKSQEELIEVLDLCLSKAKELMGVI